MHQSKEKKKKKKRAPIKLHPRLLASCEFQPGKADNISNTNDPESSTDGGTEGKKRKKSSSTTTENEKRQSFFSLSLSRAGALYYYIYTISSIYSGTTSAILGIPSPHRPQKQITSPWTIRLDDDDGSIDDSGAWRPPRWSSCCLPPPPPLHRGGRSVGARLATTPGLDLTTVMSGNRLLPSSVQNVSPSPPLAVPFFLVSGCCWCSSSPVGISRLV